MSVVRSNKLQHGTDGFPQGRCQADSDQEVCAASRPSHDTGRDPLVRELFERARVAHLTGEAWYTLELQLSRHLPQHVPATRGGLR